MLQEPAFVIVLLVLLQKMIAVKRAYKEEDAGDTLEVCVKNHTCQKPYGKY